jgi:hypothetical protein
MPAKSQAQFRLMQGVAHGSIKKEGLSKAQASEYVKGQSPKGLPESVESKTKKRLGKFRGKLKSRKN